MTGSTIHKHYARGYQAALQDLLNEAILNADNPAGAIIEWIANNVRPTTDVDYVEYAKRVQTWIEVGII